MIEKSPARPLKEASHSHHSTACLRLAADRETLPRANARAKVPRSNPSPLLIVASGFRLPTMIDDVLLLQQA